MKHSHQEILDKMAEAGMIPVFNHTEIEIAKKVLDTAYAAGVKVFEFTNREANAFEVFRELKIYAEQYPDLLIGIGTIFSRADAERFSYLEPDFIVSPALIPEVAQFCQMKNIFWVPGCATVSEVYSAKSIGAKLIKAFPGNVLGPAFIKAVLSVIPDVLLMPTGGVEPTKENLSSWFNAGVHCVGMGSQLLDKKLISSGNFTALQAEFEKAKQLIDQIKG